MASADYMEAVKHEIKVFRKEKFIGYYVSHQKAKIDRHQYIEVKTAVKEKTYFYIRTLTISGKRDVEDFIRRVEEAKTTKILTIP